MTSQDHEQLLGHIRHTLDQSVAQLDGDTRERLDYMRSEAAMQQLKEPVNDCEENLLMAARVALDDSIEELSPSLLAGLNEARTSALAQVGITDPERGVWRQLTARLKSPLISVPAGAFATACVLVTVTALFNQITGQRGSEVADADVILFASSEEIELYDNLEFYLWLADNGLPN